LTVAESIISGCSYPAKSTVSQLTKKDNHQVDAANEEDLSTTEEIMIYTNPNDASMVTGQHRNDHLKNRKKKKKCKRVSNVSSNKQCKTAEKNWIEDCSDSVLPVVNQNASTFIAVSSQ
jgi:hypothetical protein